MFKQDDDGYYSMRIYDPLYDRGFVKYAYKKTGIYFNEELFQLSLESSNELGNTDFKKGDKSVVSIEMFQIYAPLVYEYVKLNNIELPSIDDDNKKYAKKIYGFVMDKKFIDFAFKKSGITFSKEMFSYFDRQEKGATDAEKYSAEDWCEDQELDCKRRIIICPDCFHKCHWIWWAVPQ